MQDDIHRFARLFDGHHVPPRFENSAMSALCNPIQLRGGQALKQLNVGKPVASVVLFEINHSQHILLPLIPSPMERSRDDGFCNNPDRKSTRLNSSHLVI